MYGRLHIYMGDGKGKSTAALGLCLRACGANQRVLYCQFLKNEHSSELAPLKMLKNITVVCGEPTDGFLFHMNSDEQTRARACARARFNAIDKRIHEEHFELVVLDEFLWLIDAEVLTLEEAIHFIQSRPKNCELVLTGGHAPPSLIDLADYVSEIKKIKHPFDQGIPARRGIEF